MPPPGVQPPPRVSTPSSPRAASPRARTSCRASSSSPAASPRPRPSSPPAASPRTRPSSASRSSSPPRPSTSPLMRKVRTGNALERSPGSPVRSSESWSAGERRPASRHTSPLTPRHKKSSRQLRAELESVIHNSVKMHERALLAEAIVSGALEEVGGAAASARKAMGDNPRAFARAEYKPVIEALTNMAMQTERAELGVKTTLAEVQNVRQLMAAIIEDLREHHKARETALAMVGENAMLPPDLDLDDVNTQACLSIAAEREDVTRAVCTRALKLVRSVRSDVELRRSRMHMAMRTARAKMDRQTQRPGSFGNSEKRDTNPASRKLATTPESIR